MLSRPIENRTSAHEGERTPWKYLFLVQCGVARDILPTTTMCMHNTLTLLPNRPCANNGASTSCQLTHAESMRTHISSHTHARQDADCSAPDSQRAPHYAPEVPKATRNPLDALELLATLLAEHDAVASRIAAGRRAGEPAPASSNDDLACTSPPCCRSQCAQCQHRSAQAPVIVLILSDTLF